MIYLLSTNRPEWASFAYTQFLKTTSCRLVVLDNSKEGDIYWSTKDCEYHHIPQLENVSQMFNYFADQYKGDEDLFYMDDDIEISKDTVPIMYKAFEQGYDCVKNCLVKVTHGEKQGLWHRRANQVGACWMSKNNLWQRARFRENTVEGVCVYWSELWDYNCRYLFLPDLANYLIHDNNVILRASKFEFILNKGID